MAQHQHPCEICERIQQCENGTHPGLISETSTGWAVLGDSQFFRGYSLLLCKSPHTELDELAPDVRWKYLQEMSLLAEAVRRVVQPHKLNYEALGNQVHHLHWHIFPRQADEPGVKQPVWGLMPTGEAAEPFKFDAERDQALKQAIRTELQSLLAQHQTE
jgi:diadenosine tetraphosphate (Ap4A) HIT family hydrolase